jgi:hypothetical protein
MAKHASTFPGFPYRLKANLPTANMFFAVFSRFEFALKNCGYASTRRAGDDSVKPNWTAFAASIRGQFAGVRNARFRDAVQLIMAAPPNTQVLRAGILDWDATMRKAGELDEDYVLRLVRTVRNNLFHGGKGAGDFAQRNRDVELMTVSLVILRECLQLAPDVGNAFKT